MGCNSRVSRGLGTLSAGSSGFLLGWAVWQPAGLPWGWLVILAIWTGCQIRVDRLFLVWFGYYLAALRLPLDSLRDYFPTPQGLFGALAAQCGLSFLLALSFVPCAIPQLRSPLRVAITTCFCLLITALPPLGSVGLASPFFGAASMFPGSGIAGLVGFMGLFALLVMVARAGPAKSGISTLALVTVLAAAIVQPVMGTSIRGSGLYCPHAVSCPERTVVPISYPFGPTVHSWSSFLRRTRLITRLARHTLQLDPAARLLLFPEAVAGPFNQAFLPLYQKLAGLLRERGTIAALGSTVSWRRRRRTGDQPRAQWSDGLVFLGRNRGELVARQPAPLVEWAPWNVFLDPAPRSMPAFWWWRMGGDARSRRIPRDAIRLGTHHWAALICYEQALVWPILWTMISHRPTLVLAPESVHWERQRSIGDLEGRMARAWGQLYGLPVAIATNLPPPRQLGRSPALSARSDHPRRPPYPLAIIIPATAAGRLPGDSGVKGSRPFMEQEQQGRFPRPLPTPKASVADAAVRPPASGSQAVSPRTSLALHHPCGLGTAMTFPRLVTNPAPFCSRRFAS